MTELTIEFGAPVVDNKDVLSAGPRAPALLQDVWLLEKLASRRQLCKGLWITRSTQTLQHFLKRSGTNSGDVILVHGTYHLTPRRLVRSTISVFALLQFYTVR